jgi:hypothetical protein
MRYGSVAVVTVMCLIAMTCACDAQHELVTPPSRSGGTLLADSAGGRLLLFGGSGSTGALDDVWELLPEGAGSYYWRQLQPTGAVPARYGHAAIIDPTHNRMLVYGSRNASGTVLGDLWQLDLSSGAWTNVTPLGASPVPRAFMVGAYHPTRNSMVVVGGSNGSSGYNDVWELILDSLKWRQIVPSGTPPAGRWSYSGGLSLALDMFVVCGGEFNGIAGDDWGLYLTPGAERWQQLATTGSSPGPRSSKGSAMDRVGGRLFVFGGFDYPGYTRRLDGLYMFDLNTLQWSYLAFGGSVPAARRNPVLAWDSGNGRFLMFGGDTDSGPSDEFFSVSPSE